MFGKILSIITSPYRTVQRFNWIPRTDDVLTQKGGSSPQSLSLYINLLNDSVVQASFDKFIGELISRDYKLEGDPVVVEALQEILDNLPSSADELTKQSTINGEPISGFKTLLRTLGEAYITGLSVAEISWKIVDNVVKPAAIKTRDPRRIMFYANSDDEIEIRYLASSSNLNGVPLPPKSSLVFRYWAYNNFDVYGNGLGRQLYALTEARKLKLADWMSYTEKYATPTAVIKYPVGVPEEELEELENMARTLGENSYTVIPENYSVDWLSPPTQGTQVFKEILEYFDRQISMLISGENTVGQEGSGGSRSRDMVADSVRIRKAAHLGTLLAEYLQSTLFKWFVEFNFPEGTEVPTLVFEFEDTDTENAPDQILRWAQQLNGLGYNFPQKYLEDNLGTPIEKIQNDLLAGGADSPGISGPIDETFSIEADNAEETSDTEEVDQVTEADDTQESI